MHDVGGQRDFGVPRGRVLLLGMFALTGLCLSGFLTVAKFRSSFHCDYALLSACKVGPFLSCDRVLSSPWSNLFGYPITIFGSSFYFVMLLLAVSCAVDRRRQAISSSLLLHLAWAGVLACLPLAYYAYFVIGGVCSYCTALYLINLSLLLSALLFDSQGHAHQRRLLWAPGAHNPAYLLLLAAGFFVAATMLQQLRYRSNIEAVGPEPRCITDVRTLPSTRLVADAPAARVDITLAVDLACAHCAKAFHYWSQVARDSDGRYRLAILHLPLGGVCLPRTSSGRSPASAFHRSCQAARAVECVETIAPGQGMEMVKALYKRHPLGTEPAFTADKLLAVAGELPGVLVEDPELWRCIKTSDHNPAQERVAEHVSFVYGEKRVRDTPAIFLSFRDEHGRRLSLGLQLRGEKRDYPDFDRFIQTARSQVEAMLGSATNAEGS